MIPTQRIDSSQKGLGRSPMLFDVLIGKTYCGYRMERNVFNILYYIVDAYSYRKWKIVYENLV